MLRVLRTIALAAVRADDEQAFLVLDERFDVADLGVAELDFKVLRRRELPIRVGRVFEDFVLLLVVADPDAARLRIVDARNLDRRRGLAHRVAIKVYGPPQRGTWNEARDREQQCPERKGSDFHREFSFSGEEGVTGRPRPDDGWASLMRGRLGPRFLGSCRAS